MNKHPSDNVGILSLIFIRWASYFTDTSQPTPVPESIDIDYYYKRMQTNWEIQGQMKNPSLFKAIIRTFAGRLIRDFSPLLIDMVAQITLGLLTGLVISYILDPPEDRYILYVYGVICILSILVSQLARHHTLLSGNMISAVIKQVLWMTLYKKTLKLSHKAIQSNVSGKLLNVASGDIELFEFAFTSVYLIMSPIAAVMVSIALFFVIGIPGIFGVGLIVLLVPLQTLISKANAKIRMKTGEHGDQRIKTTTEMIEGIRVLKMYAWEIAFASLIKAFRAKEIKINRWRMSIRASNLTIFLVSQGLACLVTFASYVALYGELNPDQIFATLSLFITAQFYLTIIFPLATEFWSTYKASAQRIQEVLMEEEISPRSYIDESENLKIRSVDAFYSDEAHVIKDARMTVKKGELCFLIGEVGSGKTSLLLTILGEMTIKTGRVLKCGTVAYVEQEPWVISATLKDNILLGKHLHNGRLEEIMRVTGLDKDLEQLSDGLDTLLGENGTTLSGGQKTRLSLARALYADADIYLLDDPLSAVDVRVGQHIFNETILEFLAGKTRILVTHQLQYIRDCDKVYRMTNGQLEKVSNASKVAINSHTETKTNQENFEFTKDQEEDEEIDVTMNSFFKYISSGWKWSIPILSLLYLITMILYMMIPSWLAYWSENKGEDDAYYLQFLGLIILVLFVLGLIRNNLISQALQTSSQKCHDKVVDRMSRFPVEFYDQNTTGRILGRLSNDVGKMDDALPWFVGEFMQVLFITFGSVIMMIIGNPVMSIICILFFFGLYKNYKNLYKNTVKHYQAYTANKTPMLSHFTATLTGCFAIRSLNLEDTFNDVFLQKTRQVTEKHMAFIALNQYMLLNNDLLGLAFISLNILGSITFIDYVDGAYLSTGMSLALTLIINLNWCVFVFVEIRTFMVSCQRMMNYLDLGTERELENENSLEIDKGSICFKRVVLKYNEKTTALNNLSFYIEGGKKAGIVGRTGSGKSSVIQALFRAVELSSGFITIDETDISGLGLHTLRKRIGVIPQNPFIFSATLRYNIDPLGEYSDEDIWKTLTLAHLGAKAESLSDGLSTELTSNLLSVGQKQLLCLARALLRKSKILVMDEATANVDLKTDKKIHKILDFSCSDSTVLIIAHRLDTIIRCDKVIVLDAGTCLEQGHPKELLDDEESEFFQMVSFAGENAIKLIETAREQYYKEE